jgi:hypothetical protein
MVEGGTRGDRERGSLDYVETKMHGVLRVSVRVL